MMENLKCQMHEHLEIYNRYLRVNLHINFTNNFKSKLLRFLRIMPTSIQFWCSNSNGRARQLIPEVVAILGLRAVKYCAATLHK